MVRAVTVALLRRLRISRPRTTSELAAAVGVSPGFIRAVEGGVKPLPAERVAAWSDALAVSPDVLMIAAWLDCTGLTIRDARAALDELARRAPESA